MKWENLVTHLKHDFQLLCNNECVMIMEFVICYSDFTLRCFELLMYLIQALEVIHELQKHFPIKRSPMRLRIGVPEKDFASLLEKLNVWNASITSKDESGSHPSVVSSGPMLSMYKCLLLLTIMDIYG